MRLQDEAELQHMSTDDIDATSRLKPDFESYLKGEEPTPLELTCAPLLESWRATVVHQFTRERDSLPLLLVLVGRVSGHPRLTDGSTIHTSQLIWLDRKHKWARTWNRVYRLGERANEELVAPI